MTPSLDETHDPALRSWVESANDPASDFPIQNLPFGVVRHGARARIGVAIGDQIADVGGLARAGLLPVGIGGDATDADTLGPLMALGRAAARELRLALSRLFRADSPGRERVRPYLLAASEVDTLLPAAIGDYTDFYASVHHATNVGSMFRPDNPLLPNYKWVPIGYHGRASSIVVSGTAIRRPTGQTRDDASRPPVVGPSLRLDYEAEIGAFVGAGNALGEAIPLARALDHLWGLCLVNDWSARDIQTWEYQPLGPFLAKNFATTISPWIVTLDALEPFRTAMPPRADGDPAPLPYLSTGENQARGAFDVTVEAHLSSARMRQSGVPAIRVSRGSFADMYWSVGQLLTHHTSNGCNLRPGDLLASGTISGASKESRGCLLERTWKGTEPLELPGGERRAFLENGDEVILRAFAERPGHRRIGFGECRGIVTG